MRAPRSWDIFCRVVDNYGDAAVCWRLARALAAAAQARTRLWIDDLGVLQRLVPEVSPGSPLQTLTGVQIGHWTADAPFGEPAEVVVEGFGCGIPEDYAEAMAARSTRSLWIVLEYLSAEAWVARHHGLPSPHPRLPLERYFFFPGFGRRTGGLVREPDLAARREVFLRGAQSREMFWRAAGLAPPAPEATLITLFGYENPALAALIDVWADGDRPVVAAVPQSRLGTQVVACLGSAAAPMPAEGASVRRGSLEVRFLPFLAQDRYDELLWVADWNFVRGEDSFVRAQWAERPFVWHIYPQAEQVHLAKLEAFLGVYCRGLAPVLARPLRALWRGWNASGKAPARAVRSAWAALAELTPAQHAALRLHAHDWAAKAAHAGDLAENLAKFCGKRLK